MFRPESPPAGLDRSVAAWLVRQFESLRRTANDALDYVYLRKTTQAPQRSIDGELRWADGTNWDPRSLGTSFGSGLYWYDSIASKWIKVMSLGAGGSVTQPTSKSTAVTLNTITGQITMNAANLPTGTSVAFTVNNNLLTGKETAIVNIQWTTISPNNYRVRAGVGGGAMEIILENVAGVDLAEAVVINFTVIPSSTS